MSFLVFVAGSLIAIVVKQRGKSEPSRRQVAAPSEGSPQKATAGGRTQATASDEFPQQTGVIAYYFHADFRCPTCKRIEALAHWIVTGDFATELREKKMAHHTIARALEVRFPQRRYGDRPPAPFVSPSPRPFTLPRQGEAPARAGGAAPFVEPEPRSRPST